MFLKEKNLSEVNVCVENGGGGTDMAQIISVELCYVDGTIKNVNNKVDQGMYFYHKGLIEYLDVAEWMVNYC